MITLQFVLLRAARTRSVLLSERLHISPFSHKCMCGLDKERERRKRNGEELDVVITAQGVAVDLIPVQTGSN